MTDTFKYTRAGETGPVSALLKTTVAVDPASIGAQTTAETTVTVTGAVVGDVVDASPLAALPTGLLFGGARVSATDTIALLFGNVTTAAIDMTAHNFNFTIQRN